MSKDQSGKIEEGGEILAKCDGCGRDIMSDEAALARYGIHCFDCCKIIWEHGIEYLETLKQKSNNGN